MFTYYVCELMTGAIVDEVPFSTFEFNRGRNVPGGWQATISHREPKNTPALLAPWTRSVFIADGQNIIAGGMLTERNSTIPGGMRVGGQGFFDYWRNTRRSIRSRAGMSFAAGANNYEITFTGVDEFNIVSDLLLHSNAYGGSASLKYDQLRAAGTGAGGLSGVPRTITYWTYNRKGIGEAIEDLANLDNGFDFAETYAWASGGTRIEKYLTLYYPNKGLTAPFALELGGNVTLLTRNEQGYTVATRFTTLGAGQDDSQLQYESVNPALEYPLGPYPLLEQIDTQSDFADISQVQAWSDRNLVVHGAPIDAIDLQILEDVDIRLGSFDWGDDAHIAIDDNAIQVNATYRIESYNVTIDENGKPTIKLTVIPIIQSLG